jgi:hypothetical protein
VTETVPAVRYVDDLTREDVLALEAFLYDRLAPVLEAAGGAGETSHLLRSLETLVCDSAGLLLVLLDRGGLDRRERRTVQHEWNRLWSTAKWWHYRDDYDTARWVRLEYADAQDEAEHRARIAEAQADR